MSGAAIAATVSSEYVFLSFFYFVFLWGKASGALCCALFEVLSRAKTRLLGMGAGKVCLLLVFPFLGLVSFNVDVSYLFSFTPLYFLPPHKYRVGNNVLLCGQKEYTRSELKS